MDKKKHNKDIKKEISVQKSDGSRTRAVRESTIFLEEMQNHGLKKLFLSPLTQKVLECRIGENITAEKRWVFIKKEKIEDNIFLHDTSSEFLPIRGIIEKYPEPELLIGSYSHIQDKETDFFLCTTLGVKDNVLLANENERKNIFDKLRNLLCPASRPWEDLGSALEVDASLGKNIRSQFEIVLSSEYPIEYHARKLTMCFVENIPNSYIEMLSVRYSYNIIKQKRVDASTQSMFPKEHKAIQCKLTNLKNKYIQYSYQSKPVEMTADAFEKVKKFFLKKCIALYETLLVNFNINLFCNDYKKLANNEELSFRDPFELRSYQDVIDCKHKKVSCVSWNAFVSGMVAVAYAAVPLYYLGKYVRLQNDAENTVHEQHLILLWMYKDNVRPILYIHANREVTALSFCPYDANILVGGYSNGQIAVWDINNRIAAVETREVLTDKEQRHRGIMQRQTAWIKPAIGIAHVFPTITSRFDSSHTSAVTSIAWLPPTHYITKFGKYERAQPNEDHMQFFTIALSGGTIQVWDLMLPNKGSEKTGKKRMHRLSKLPVALTQAESPLKKLQPTFAPLHRFYVKSPLTGIKSPLTNIIVKNQAYTYKALNPETIENVEERTYFQVLGSSHPVDVTQQVILSTALGTLFSAEWEGGACNQGLSVNSGMCTTKNFADVHDGPITTCEVNPLMPEILLTTGGSVFAIWHCKKLQMRVPLIWRKCSVRYIRGIWSFRHPLTLFMARSDSYFDIWNMLEQSENPVRSFKCKGNQLISLFNDVNRLHARKNTFITADIVGAIKVFNLPMGIISLSDSCNEESKKYVKQVITIKARTEALKIKVKKDLEAAAQRNSQKEEREALPQQDRPESNFLRQSHVRLENIVATSINKWQKRQELHMRNILLEKKNLNIEEIEKNRKPMQEMADQRMEKQKKFNQKVMTREDNYEKLRETVLVEPIEGRTTRRKIKITLPKEITQILKQKYFDNFKSMEGEVLEQIRTQTFKFKLDWSHMLQFGVFKKRK